MKWLQRSRQAVWLKVAVGAGLVVLAGAVAQASYFGSGGDSGEVAVVLGGTILGAGALGLGALARIRCKACGARVALRAMRRFGLGVWLRELMESEVCLACGERGDGALPRASHRPDAS